MKNIQTELRMGQLSSDLATLKNHAYSLQTELNQKLRYFKKCQ